MRVHLTALGCRLNEAELEGWARRFCEAGDQIVASADNADVVVLNTCAVTAEAERKSRQRINRVHRENPLARLVVTGCSATLAPAQMAQRLGVHLVVPNAVKDRLVQITRSALDCVPTATGRTNATAATALFARGRQRAFVKVQDGCRYRCTFCIVTAVRGTERSRPIDEVVDEINGLVACGVREVVLTGVHLGGFGHDRHTDLYQLLRAVLERTSLERLRLGSVEPWDLPGRFFELFEDSRLMPHLHLPLQSGSDAVLRRMARRCQCKDFAALVARARTCIPQLNITSDVIVGFPGESEAEWRETVTFIEDTGFGHVHVFPYSRRPGTKAANLPAQVPREVLHRRLRELHALALRHKRALLTRHVGQTAPVLLERKSPMAKAPDAEYFGYTPNYLRVGLRAPSKLEGRTLPVRLLALDARGESLHGQLA